MSELDILKWDVDFGNTTSGGRNTYVPYVHIQPNLEWLSTAKANDNILYVEVSDSGIYDGGYRAVLEPTSNLPNPRPNYFAATGTYALTLVDADWGGYPPNGALGTVKISDAVVLPGKGYVTPNTEEQQAIEDTADKLAETMVQNRAKATDDPPPPDTTSAPWYVWLIVGVVLLIILLLILFSFLHPRRGRYGGPPPPPGMGGRRPGISINL